MKKTLLLLFLAIIALLTFLSVPLFASGGFVKPTATATVTATPETSFYPISTTALVPTMAATIPYTATIDRKELEQVQFIDADTIVYRQWGNLYVHHLITQTTQLILDGQNITSLNWSSIRQQFVVIKEGRLLLVDMTGEIIKDVSAILAKENSGFEVSSCNRQEGLIKADSSRIKDAEWSIDESSVQFAYTFIDGCYYISLWEFNPDSETLDLLNASNDSWIWLNAQTLVSSSYFGGGSQLFSIIDMPNDKIIFKVEAWGTYPIGSSDGSRLAIATYNLRKLLVFDTVTGKQLVGQDFGHKNPDKDTIISAINFSNTGRYVAVQGMVGIESNILKPKYMMAIVDVETGTLWSPPMHSPHFLPGIIWLPDRDQALMFEREDNTTYLSQLSPETEQIMPMGKITDTLAAPYTWPGDSRYLPLTDQKIYNAADYITYWGDPNAGIWLWDRQKGGLPYPIYLVTPVTQGEDNVGVDAAVIAPMLSPDETWLVFGQQVGWSSSNNPYVTNFTLQAIHLSSGHHHQITMWDPQDAQ